MPEFRVSAKWMAAASGEPEVRAAAALLDIYVDNVSLTRNQDIWAETVRDNVFVSAYPLAIWFVSNLIARNLGTHAGGNEIKRWQPEQIDAMALLDEQKQALKANLAVMRCLDSQVDALERSILAKAKLREDYKALKTVSGIGEVLAPQVLGSGLVFC